jgi:hypothetical protein
LSYDLQEEGMIPPPVTVGLILCKYVHVEEGGSHRVSLIGSFAELRVESFPAAPAFFVYFALTDGLGDATITLRIQDLDTGKELYRRENRIRFEDKLKVVQGYFPVSHCTFSAPGWYQTTILVDGE